MRVLVTGSAGFIGKNLCANLALRSDIDLLTCDVDDAPDALEKGAAQADFVFHLAGVNRPQDPAEFARGNADLTRRLTGALMQAGRKTPIALASSTQAALDNAYGASKRDAEQAVADYAQQTGAAAYAFRFPGVFGKWCRPHYNSVVATFCHQTVMGLPLTIDDPDKRIALVYIDDVVAALLDTLEDKAQRDGEGFCQATPVHTVALGELARQLTDFRQARKDFTLRGDRGDAFIRKLYATYLSYLPHDDFAVAATQHTDARGYFAELMRMPSFGQISVSRTKPGVTRGQHWHNTKVEKFIVVQGEGVIRFRRIDGTHILEYPVHGDSVQVVDIPPGYTHSITNTGSDDLILLIWAGELFDPEHPDTHYLEV